jgi:hypothetical protein
MRYTKFLFVAVLAAFIVGLTVKTPSISAQGQVPACTDQTILGGILTAMTQDPFVEAYSKLESASTPDDFANVVDLGIKARQTLMAVSVNPSDQGCFFLQLSALALLTDEIDAATYVGFIKAGLKNAEAYQKSLVDVQTRLKKNNETFQALAKASLPPATPAP